MTPELEALLKELCSTPDWALPVQGRDVIERIRKLLTEHYN